MNEFALMLAGSIVGGVLASLIGILIWDQYKKPKLKIEIPEKTPGKEPSPQPEFSRAFYHLKVRNEGKSPAYSCRVIMRFFDEGRKTQLFAPVNGKWDRGPEPLIFSPVPVEVLPDGKLKIETRETRQNFVIPFAETIDIHPRMPSEGFGVVVKYENEKECWPFSSWSYILGHGHRVHEWRLDGGKYVVEIELLYSGKGSVKRKFLLINEGTTINSVEIKSCDAQAGGSPTP
jgi:hypothetical protein